MEQLLALLPVVAILVAITNIAGDVIKECFNGVPAQVVVTAIAVVLTVLCVVAYFCILKDLPLQWYYIVGGIIGGICVAYAAMFGYDNLYSKVTEAFKKAKDDKDFNHK